jgi:malonate transporter and related proteins
MEAILAVTAPFFALVLCGYVAAQRRILPESAIPGLNSFVLYWALPCMLFRFGASTPVLELLHPVIFSVWLLCATLVVFFCVGLTWRGRIGLKDASFGALVAAFPNTGFMGVPLLVALLGPQAAGPTICTILVDIFITSSVCIALAEAADAADHGLLPALRKALKGALINPLPWSIALGAASSISGWVLLGPADKVVKMLADAASPVALFTIGAVLWRSGQTSRVNSVEGARSDTSAAANSGAPWSLVWPVAVIKLILHPMLVFLALSAARQAGFDLSRFQIVVLTLVAALPSASNVSMLAERYRANNGRIARIILASTAAAFLTFSAVSWMLNIQPVS